MLSDCKPIFIVNIQLKKMMCADIEGRYLIDDVLKHSWLSVYLKQYQSTYGQKSIHGNNNSIYHQLLVYKMPLNHQ